MVRAFYYGSDFECYRITEWNDSRLNNRIFKDLMSSCIDECAFTQESARIEILVGGDSVCTIETEYFKEFKPLGIPALMQTYVKRPTEPYKTIRTTKYDLSYLNNL